MDSAKKCANCGATIVANTPRAIVCGKPECREARRRARDQGLPGVLPPEVRQCVICGAEFRANRNLVCCSAECLLEKKRRKQRESWRRRITKDPSLTKKMNRRRREKAAANPEYAAKIQEWERRRREKHRQRMATDADYASKFRARTRLFYARNAERIADLRRKRLSELTIVELEERRQRARIYLERYRQKILQDPERRQSLLDNDRQQRRRAKRARINLAAIGQELSSRLKATPKQKPCRVCGKPIVGRSPSSRLCGQKECQLAYQRQRQAKYRATPQQRQCVVCGSEFATKCNRVTCSDACRRQRKKGKKP